MCNNLFILLDDYGFVKNSFSALPQNSTGIEYEAETLSCARGNNLYDICDPILENHTFGHMQNLWEFSIENFSDFF